MKTEKNNEFILMSARVSKKDLDIFKRICKMNYRTVSASIDKFIHEEVSKFIQKEEE